METLEVYHVTTKSIAGYVIFNNEKEYLRMKQLLQYYQVENPPARFSYFLARQKGKKELINDKDQGQEKLNRIIAYCLMPTHIHLVLQQLKKSGISIYMNRVLNSYTRYFNAKHHRKGPLWTGRFKRVLVETDEQLIHLTRYIHLNPVTAYLVDKPELWQFSSYHEYLTGEPMKEKVCEFKHFLEISPNEYREFVDDQISYQRELAAIKDLILE
ncbi:MAG: transposase [Actinomycetota bacterium]|nr:transposase [Actinomycetota bacterium]